MPTELCTPVVQVAERQNLRSASRRLLVRAKNTARHVRSSCVRRGWSDRLERTRQRSARSRYQLRQLRCLVKDEACSVHSIRCTERIRGTVRWCDAIEIDIHADVEIATCRDHGRYRDGFQGGPHHGLRGVLVTGRRAKVQRSADDPDDVGPVKRNYLQLVGGTQGRIRFVETGFG